MILWKPEAPYGIRLKAYEDDEQEDSSKVPIFS